MLYELDGIRRVFQGKTVLDLPRLTIDKGKIYTLIGPNGAGKTTLLHLLAFLDKQTEGVLRFCGEEVTSSAKQLVSMRRRVSLLDQYPILFTGPVWKNVEYGLRIRKVPKDERRKRVEEMLDLVGMSSFYKADAHKLSGGETKRIALARALAVRPEVLLCDEPGANVDKENQEIILNILGHIKKTENTSVIFSTHYLSQGRRLADQTLMLEHGRLSDIVNENIFRARVTRRGAEGITCFIRDRVSLVLPEDLLPGETETFRLYIDAERVQRIENGDMAESSNNLLSGHVIQVNQDRGRVRIGIDLEIKLFFFEELSSYLKNPPHIGQKITVSIPDKAFRHSSLG
ncbi:ABC transporter ATP-binding protein [Desulfopila sp. IMCC35008]|uniref:ABC transporter ATP-binding protein n=1 Tax=Desulfopila sp. IMCC35008 TaxID=2653858 RepID=UPI0013D074A8|nr:ATP-binding cassette domain-containing protein [Desulfopila sp. IMCC35008]